MTVPKVVCRFIRNLFRFSQKYWYTDFVEFKICYMCVSRLYSLLRTAITTVYQKPFWSILNIMFFTFRGQTGTLKPFLLLTCREGCHLPVTFIGFWKQNGDHLKPRLLWIRTWWCSFISGKWVSWLLLIYFISLTRVWKGLRLLGTLIYFL